MAKRQTSAEYLDRWATKSARKRDAAQILGAVTAAACEISALVEGGPLAGALGAERGQNADGDVQKELDLRADDLLVARLRETPVIAIVSEEHDEPIVTGRSDKRQVQAWRS